MEIRYYGLVYALGFLVLYIYLMRKARRDPIKNLDERRTETFMLYVMIGIIVGARVLDFVFYNPGVLLTDPVEVFRIWNGGMSFHGGLIGAAAAMYMFSRKHGVSFYELADALAIPAAFFLGLGRIANFINGELPGTITDVSWCVVFPGAEGCRHPYVLYESLKNFIVFGALIWIKSKKELVPGKLFWIFTLLYSSLRFLLDFVRDEPRFLGITTGQYLSIAFTTVAVYFLLRKPKKLKQKRTR